MEFPEVKECSTSNAKQMKHANKTIQEMLKGKLKEFHIIVDVGCGSGNVAQMLWKLVPHNKIYAFDNDTNVVEFAKHNYNDGNIHWFLDDIGLQWNDLSSTMRDLEGRVSLVWCDYVLHWVEDKNTAMKNIARLLKSEGRVYLRVPHLPCFNELLPRHKLEEHERFMKYPTKDEDLQMWNNILSESGLSSFNISKIPVALKSNGAWNKLVDASDTQLRKFLNKSIPEEKKPEYLEKFRNMYLRALATQPGKPLLQELPTNPIGHFIQYVVTGTK